MTQENLNPLYDYDLIVIGGGSGGVRGARWAGARGLKVAVVEGRRWGGTCVNLGCVPKKLYVHAAHHESIFQDASSFGWSLEPPTHHWPTLKINTDAYIARLNRIYERLLDQAGVDRLNGWARFVDEHTVEIDRGALSADRGDDAPLRLTARSFLIATGGAPQRPDVVGVEESITSDDFFALERAPSSVLVVGGGYIGVELAGVLKGLGVEVTLAHRGPLILRGFDRDLRTQLNASLQAQGVPILYETSVQKIERCSPSGPSALRVTLKGRGAPIEVEEVLFATGRSPKVSGLDLERAGVHWAPSGGVIVDEHYQTSQPHIFAVGDVIDRVQLTPVALAEAMYVAERLTGTQRAPLDYDLIPTAVFSEPPLGTVGLTEEVALSRGHRVTLFETDFRPLHHSLPQNPIRVYMKLVVDRDSDRVLGCHMMGPEAGEIIQGLAVAMRAGATKADFDATIGIHPTMAEEWVTLRSPRASQE
jgi:glutathione reductase (NADPH)